MRWRARISTFIVCVLIGLYLAFFVVAVPVDKNTVALWLFDEGSGEVVKDLSGNGNDGKVVEAEWVAGKFGAALNFDGIGGKADYVEVPGSANLDITEALTIEAWVNIKEHQDDNIRVVCAYNAGVNAGYSLLIARGGLLSSFLHLGGWSQSTAQAEIPEGEWTHIALSFDGDAHSENLKLYMNGEVGMKADLGGKITSRGMAPVYIARFNAGDPETPDGMIDEIRISNVARTQAEIQKAMNGLAKAPVKPLDKLTITWGSLKND